MSIELTAGTVTVEAKNSNKMKVTLDIDADDVVGQLGVRELLEYIDIGEVLEHYPTGELLEKIGKADCLDHFGVIEAEE